MHANKRILVFIFLFLLSFSLFSQEKTTKDLPKLSLNPQRGLQNKINSPIFTPKKYWIMFKDKENIDVPISVVHLAKLKEENIKIESHSKWLNCVSAYISDEKLVKIKQFDYVKEVILMDKSLKKASFKSKKERKRNSFVKTQTTARFEPTNDATLSICLFQMNARAFTEAGISGKNVRVGITDAGFWGADKDKSLQHLFKKGTKENKILFTKDFISPKQKFFNITDSHGTTVLSKIAGKTDKNITGLAYGADFYLVRTENDAIEARTEEENWLRAIEMLDSLGVRLVNVSLGYSLDFTNPEENYTMAQMDGKTAFISRAAKIATEQKGMIIVVSAGNDGTSTSWDIISAPADVSGVIAVGATEVYSRMKMNYSSEGSENVPFVKPDVACQSFSGTSFAAPIITGFVACLLEKQPNLTNEAIKNILHKSSHLYPFANTFIGYGIPQADIALKVLENPDFDPKRSSIIEVQKDIKTGLKADFVEILDIKSSKVILFHKKNKTVAFKQLSQKTKAGKIIIKKAKKATHTTVDAGDKVIEIVW